MKLLVPGERREAARLTDGVGAEGAFGFVAVDGSGETVFDVLIGSFAFEFREVLPTFQLYHIVHPSAPVEKLKLHFVAEFFVDGSEAARQFALDAGHRFDAGPPAFPLKSFERVYQSNL